MMKTLCFVFVCVTSVFSQQTINKILAVVGENIITKQDLDEAVQQQMMQQRGAKADQIRAQVFQQMLELDLLYIKSQLDSVQINNDMISQQTDQRFRYFVQQIGSELQLEEYFNMPAKKIKKNLRKTIEKQMAVEMLNREFTQNLKVSNHEVKAFFKTFKDSLPTQPEQVELARIVIYPTPNASVTEKALAKAESVYKRLAAGEEFAELAKELSDDGSAQNGGYLGKVKREGQFVQEYVDAVYELNNAGDVTPKPVKSPFGYHIIKLHSKTTDEFESSHILFMVKPDHSDLDLAKQTLTDIRNDIQAKKISFEDAAVKHNTDEATKGKNGYLGIFPMAQIPDETIKSKVAFMKEGELSEPFVYEDPYVRDQAVQILFVMKRTEEQNYDINTHYSAIEQFALNKKRNEEMVKMLQTIKKEIPVTIYN